MIFVRVIILVGAGNLVRNSATVEAVVRVIIVNILDRAIPGYYTLAR